jgi:hypothetical protein
VKPFIAALIAGAIVFIWAYHGARWGWTGSVVIAAVWAAMAYALTRALTDPEPGVSRR